MSGQNHQGGLQKSTKLWVWTCVLCHRCRSNKFPQLVTNVTPIIRTHNILTSHNQAHKNPLQPIKKLNYYGFVSQQVTSKKLSWELCWIIFLRLIRHQFFMSLLITFHIQSFLGPLLKKKRELDGTRFINKACILYKRLLGTSGVLQVQSKLRRRKFRQLEECPHYINKSLWFSGLGAGLSPWSHRSNPYCIHIFF